MGGGAFDFGFLQLVDFAVDLVKLFRARRPVITASGGLGNFFQRRLIQIFLNRDQLFSPSRIDGNL